ncbi:MAG TPA: ATP-binding protein [Thermoanaerobaculia bacterium]|nr:ATP-binding protein [Thermoanaerobaculia bacterium]
MTAFDGLPINLESLLHGGSIESNRIEFKAGWDEHIKPAVIRTVCAFANDFLNLGGGYLILGVREEGGRPILPPAGLQTLDLEKLQKEVRGACKRIVPDYLPFLFPYEYEGVPLLVIWAPGGDTRPYQSPEALASGSPLQFWIRRGPETIKAQGEDLRQLIALTAKVPFDDRRNLEARIEDLSPLLVRRFLNDIRSDLINHSPSIDDRQIFRLMNLAVRINSHEVPRNVGLIFFNEDPDKFFRGARTEVVQFGDDAGGDLIEERVFRGPISTQIKSVLDYLNSLGGTLVRKVRGQAEAERTVPYPYEAMEEAIVNAFYHRGYDGPSEPVKVYLYPDRMEIISYPGPVPGIQLQHLEPGALLPPVPARNRRIGDFLKELRLAEGRGSGIPKIRRKMSENGSPDARFDFDQDHTYFRVTLPVHPQYLVLHAQREASHLWVVGEKSQALDHLERTFERQQTSDALVSQIIEYSAALGDLQRAINSLEKYAKSGGTMAQPFLSLAGLLLDQKRAQDAIAVLASIPVTRTREDTVEAAILKKRAGDLEGAHHSFAEAYSINPDDPRLVHEFAQTKIGLASTLPKRGKNADIKNRLNREIAELLRRAIQLSTDPVRQAWCWLDLAKTLQWLDSPRSEIESAFQKAISLNPNEHRFREAYKRWIQGDS